MHKPLSYLKEYNTADMLVAQVKIENGEKKI